MLYTPMGRKNDSAFRTNRRRRAGCMDTSAAGWLNREILSEERNLPFLLGRWKLYKLSLPIHTAWNVGVISKLGQCITPGYISY